MKCNLIIPGFPKCGTTSLHEYLDGHPEIQMSSNKEPHYFSRDSIYSMGEDWYDQLFASAKEDAHIFGESSTSYAYDNPAMERIRRDVPDAKLILMLRNPVDRLLSHYRWMYAQGYEVDSLAEALRKEEESDYNAERSVKGSYKTYLKGSQYSQYVPHIVEQFGSERVKILRSEDLMSDRLVQLNECYDFLDVSGVSQVAEIQVNKTEEQKKQKLLWSG